MTKSRLNDAPKWALNVISHFYLDILVIWTNFRHKYFCNHTRHWHAVFFVIHAVFFVIFVIYLCHRMCCCLYDSVMQLNKLGPEVDQITPQHGTQSRLCAFDDIGPFLNITFSVTVTDIDMHFSLCHKMSKCLQDCLIRLSKAWPKIDEMMPQNDTQTRFCTFDEIGHL